MLPDIFKSMQLFAQEDLLCVLQQSSCLGQPFPAGFTDLNGLEHQAACDPLGVVTLVWHSQCTGMQAHTCSIYMLFSICSGDNACD